MEDEAAQVALVVGRPAIRPASAGKTTRSPEGGGIIICGSGLFRRIIYLNGVYNRTCIPVRFSWRSATTTTMWPMPCAARSFGRAGEVL